MRTAILACFTVLALAACSPQPAKQDAPPAATTTAGPSYSVTLTSPDQLTLPANSPIHVTAGEQGLRLQGVVVNPSAQLKTDGASVDVGSANEEAFAGHQVRVTIRARGVDGATAFTSAYSTHGNGNSGWRHMRVTDAYSDVSFMFAVPALVRREGDFIGIVPPASGAVEVQSIHAEIVEPAEGLRN